MGIVYSIIRYKVVIACFWKKISQNDLLDCVGLAVALAVAAL